MLCIRRRALPALLLAAGATACASSAALDDEDDRFLDAATRQGLGDEDRCAVLRLAREATPAELASTGLHPTAAESLVRQRSATWLASLEELDAVPFVGPRAFAALRDRAATDAVHACGTVEVQLLAFNDFHGHLEPPPGSSGRIAVARAPDQFVAAGGAAYLASHLARLRDGQPHSFTVAAGDLVGATPLVSALFRDEPTIESLGAAGLEIAGVGNHEFDQGAAELLRLQDGGCHPVDGCRDGDGFAGAPFRYLAANVIELTRGAPLLPAYELRAVRGARLAFIGLTLEGTPEVTAGAAGLHFADEAETVNRLVPELRQQGVEAIAVLLHEGGFVTGLHDGCEGISGPIVDIVQRLDPAVDVVITGHTNAAHVCTIAGKLVTSAASHGRLVTEFRLGVRELDGEVVSAVAHNQIVTRDIAPDPTQEALIARYRALARPYAEEIVGRTEVALSAAADPAGESPLGNLIADAQLEATAPRTGAQIAFMNPGGIRADLPAGAITFGQVFSVQPFGNTLTSMSLSGAQLAELLEQQWRAQPDGSERAMVLAVSREFTYEWDPVAPIGRRIVPGSLRLAGAPIDPRASYRIVVNSFLAGGGDGFTVLRAGTERVGGPVDLDALRDHFRVHSPVRMPTTGRIRRRPVGPAGAVPPG
jgi:5'-nucleotidase